MKTKGIRCLAVMAALALGACGGGEKTETAAEAEHGHSHAEGEAAHSHEGEAHEHDGEEHAHEEEEGGGHSHGTVEHALGKQSAGDFHFTAAQMDDISPGSENVFIVNFEGNEPASVRLWVGDESASRSIKALAEKDGLEFHAHVESPETIGPEDHFWIEIEAADGSVTKSSFALAEGTVLPPRGPHTGLVVPLKGTDGSTAYAELKLHDDKGDLEIWLARDAAITEPLDINLDSVIAVAFPELDKNTELRVRNREKNEDEDGNPNIRGGLTHYFIFPGETGADASWLVGEFRSQAVIRFTDGALGYESEPFTLVPHAHGEGEHHH